MIFGPFEILLCLGPLMLFMGTIGVQLYKQNRRLEKKERNRGMKECPNCHKMLNREAYICRFCSQELPVGTKHELADF
jgi:uncharacterized paraquat-inducible protein A